MILLYVSDYYIADALDTTDAIDLLDGLANS